MESTTMKLTESVQTMVNLQVSISIEAIINEP